MSERAASIHSGSSQTLADEAAIDPPMGAAEKLKEGASSPPAPGPPPANTKDPNIVQFDGPDDPLNPQNWSFRQKFFQTFLISQATLVVVFASSVFAYSTEGIAEAFGVSLEVATLGTSLYLAGYVIGPIVWGPFSEYFGRRRPLLLSYLGFVVFQIGPAVATNLQTIMICRFFAGAFAIGPPSICGGQIVDMWGPKGRGNALVAFCMSVIAGPALGPVVGGFIAQSYLGWRWTSYITLIWGGALLACLVVFLKETFAPVILQAKATDLRYETGNWALHGELDEKRFSARAAVNTYLMRPIFMLAREPILLISTIYVSFIYGLLFGLFEAVPYVFGVQRTDFNLGEGGLPFLAFLVGAMFSCGLLIAFNSRLNRVLAERKTLSAPDERCLPMCLGAILFPVGLFIFAFTGVEEGVTSPWGQIIALVPIGAGFVLIFLPCFLLLIDCYLMLANSAIAAQTMLRSASAAAFPLFATQMFENLGTNYAGLTLALIAVALGPFPFVFRRYTTQLMRSSKYIPAFNKPKPLQAAQKGDV